MSAQPIAYGDVDHEAALKYAVQLIDHRWAQVIEGRIVLVSPMWDHEKVDGPHPFGTPVRLPAPFGLTLDTTGS
ncbi:hypothetical protein ACIRBX_33345 [Kitasatospora sp. NPDC096147]|uniref:hypothetical protein n=1 Tax=Kitasatospora sp. NPDC096147 TaxID=3364093 RepID=UPI003801A9BC